MLMSIPLGFFCTYTIKGIVKNGSGLYEAPELIRDQVLPEVVNKMDPLLNFLSPIFRPISRLFFLPWYIQLVFTFAMLVWLISAASHLRLDDPHSSKVPLLPGWIPLEYCMALAEQRKVQYIGFVSSSMYLGVGLALVQLKIMKIDSIYLMVVWAACLGFWSATWKKNDDTELTFFKLIPDKDAYLRSIWLGRIDCFVLCCACLLLVRPLSFLVSVPAFLFLLFLARKGPVLHKKFNLVLGLCVSILVVLNLFILSKI
jgi:hypothetical protein